MPDRVGEDLISDEQILKSFGWDSIKKRIFENEELGSSERGQILHNVDFLITHFSNAYIIEAYRNHGSLFDLLWNGAAWSQRRLAWLGKSLEESKRFDPSGNLLIKAKKNEQGFDEVWTLLEAASYLETKFEVEYEPDLLSIGHHKRPDFGLLDRRDKNQVLMEVTFLGEAEREKRYREAEQEIRNMIVPKLFSAVVTGALMRSPRVPRLKEILRGLENLAKNFEETKEFQTFCIPDIIEIAVSKSQDDRKLEAWCKTRKYEPGHFYENPPRVDQVSRIDQRLRAKAKQLPDRLPGILFLMDLSFAHGPLPDSDSFDEIVLDVAEEVFAYESISVLVLRWSSIGEYTSRRIRENIQYVSHEVFGLSMQQTLFVWNPYARSKIEGDFRERVISGLCGNHDNQPNK